MLRRCTVARRCCCCCCYCCYEEDHDDAREEARKCQSGRHGACQWQPTCRSTAVQLYRLYGAVGTRWFFRLTHRTGRFGTERIGTESIDGGRQAWKSDKAVVPCQNKIISKNFSMNIHEAVLQPIAAFVYCNRQAAACRRQQTNVGNFRAQQEPTQLTPPMGGVSLKLFYDGTTREIK